MSLTGRARQAIAGASFVVLFAPAGAFAQFAPLAPAAPGDRTTQVDLIADLIYDSNVAASDAALAAARHIKPSDVIIEPSIRIDLARPVGRQTVFLLATAGYDAYARNSRLDRENISVNPGVLGQFSRCEFDISGSYSRGQTDLQELALTPGGPAPGDVRNTLVTEQLTGGAQCGRQVGFAPTVRVTENWTRNSLPIERAVDVNAFSTQDGISYRRPSFGNVTLFGSYSTATYPDRFFFMPVPGLNVGYNTYSGGISYTRPVGARLVGSASVSYTKLNNSTPGAKGFSGFTYSAALNYAVNPRLGLSVNVARATLPSNRLNSTFEIDELYSTKLDYRLTQRGSIGIGASYEHQNFSVIPGFSRFDLTKETIYTGFANAEYRLNRRLSLAITLDQSHRSADYPGLTFDDTRATLSVKSSF